MHVRWAGYLGLAGLIAVYGCGPNGSTGGSAPPVVGAAKTGSNPPSIPTLDDSALDRLCRAPAKAVVLIFIRCECPIANRYAPEIRRLSDEFTPQGVVFDLIYPEPSDSLAAVREHLTAFGYTCSAWRDPNHVAVKRFGPKVTPEAVVVDCATKKAVYLGRIDDLYVDFGTARQAATTHDLRDAVAAVLAGKPVLMPSTNAVGCSIGDAP